MTERRQRLFRAFALATVVTFALTGCDWDFSGDVDNKQPDENNRRQSRTKSNYDDSYGTIFGEGGISILGGGDEQQAGTGGPGIGVNTYLWRASLDTVAFMPLASADPFGGVIITDWYSPPDAPNERFKVNVFILTRDLTASGVRTTVFRQRQKDGQWVDEPVDQKTGIDLEDAILQRARELRIAQQLPT